MLFPQFIVALLLVLAIPANAGPSIAKKTNAPTTTPPGGITCKNTRPDGIQCTSEIAYFSTVANSVTNRQDNADGTYSFTLINPIPRAVAGTTISFISVSDCSGACVKTNSVPYQTPVYNGVIPKGQE